MKSLNAPHCLALAATTAVFACSSYGAVTTTTNSSTVVFSSTTWKGELSGTDLINSNQSTLSGVTYAGMPNGAGGLLLNRDGLNNGHLATTDGGNSSATGTYIATSGFDQPGNTAVVTFNLNITTPGNTFGYDITSIKSFMGLNSNSQAQANQTYTVAFSYYNDGGGFTDFATVNYTPFFDVNGIHESYVNIADTIPNAVIASNVDAIRFTFVNPLSSVANGAGTFEGTVIRELDVNGIASVPEPSAALLGGLGMLALLRRRRA